MDGLDEVSRRDGKFTEEVPLALRYPGVLWICSGRPEPMITEPIRKLGGEDLFPHGLPPMREEDVRGMILEKIGPLRKKLLGKDAEQDGKVINPFIRLVTERAAGLPLYVKYVIGDVLGGKYRVLDGEEELPDSLHSYHEELLRRLGVGDLQAVVTPLAAILATAYEPLSVRELVAILVHRKLLTEEGARQMVEKGLAAIASMVRSAPDPEGEVGYCLFHQSLRDHMTGSDQMTHSIATAREAFADLAEQENQPGVLRNYLLRCGIDHLLEVGRSEEAERQLLDLDHLSAMVKLGVINKTLYKYWNVLGGRDRAIKYQVSIDSLQQSPTPDGLSKLSIILGLSQFSYWSSLSKLALNAELRIKKEIGLGQLEVVETLLGLANEHMRCEAPNDAYQYLSEAYSNLCESLGLSPVSPSELKIPEVISVGEKSEKIDLVLKLSDIFDAIGYAFELKIELDSKHEERDRIVKFEKQKRWYFENAFKIRNELLDADHKLVAASYLNLIDSIPDVDQALKYFEKILCIRLEEYGPLHPTVAKVYKRRGWFLVKNRKQLGRKVKRANAQTSDTKYSWVPIHVELSEKLREYKGRSSELVSIIKKMNGQGLRTIPLEDGSDGELLEEIDPFTFFCQF